MHNDQGEHRADKAYGMPPLLAVYEPIGNDHMQWIVPDPLGEVKGDIVLREVDPSLLAIPLEANHVRTILYVHRYVQRAVKTPQAEGINPVESGRQIAHNTQ